MNYLKRFWAFLHEDSWSSFMVTLLIAFVVIKFVFFPGLSFLTGTELPLVIVESCSMHHYEDGFEKILDNDVYYANGISLEDSLLWPFQNGLEKGDIIFVVGADNVEVGDVIIFNGGANHPIIHRLVSADEVYSTKGDNYKTNSGQLSSEKDISEDAIIGKALFKIPYLGWAKLIFFEWGRYPSERGLCG